MRADHRLSAGCLSPGRQQLESSGGLKLLKGSEVIQLFAAKRQEGPLTLPRLRFRVSQRTAEAKPSTAKQLVKHLRSLFGFNLSGETDEILGAQNADGRLAGSPRKGGKNTERMVGNQVPVHT